MLLLHRAWLCVTGRQASSSHAASSAADRLSVESISIRFCIAARDVCLTLLPAALFCSGLQGLKELKELISSYQSMRDSGRAVAICQTIIETARQCNLDKVRFSFMSPVIKQAAAMHMHASTSLLSGRGMHR